MHPASQVSPLARFVLAAALAAAPLRLAATNGMNLEGYGPIATAMGGASMAYDNGTAAVINNPATLALMPDGSRLDLALGVLGPNITATSPDGQSAKSQSRAFFMPALGYAHRGGNLTWGVGIFGQGGMGCEYKPDTWRGLGFNLENRSEVSVGRFIVPVAWEISDQLTLAATADFIWAGMDVRMAMSGMQFFDLIDPSMQNFGRASGQLVQTMGQVLSQMPEGTSVDYAYFDFSNGSPFTGEAKGYGWAGKLGLLYRPNDSVSLGLTYHAKTHLSDLESSGANLAFQLNVPEMGAMAQTLGGEIRIRDFEWPAMLGAGLAWQPTSKWTFVFDVRQVYWSDAMDSFRMDFTSSADAANGPFASQNLQAELFQDWSDQTVYMAGAAYRLSDSFTLRFGGNFGDNPVPDQYLNCLFPATVEKHLSAGFGWQVNDRSTLDFSLVRGFENERTSGYGVTVSHSQLNAQAMYSIRF